MTKVEEKSNIAISSETVSLLSYQENSDDSFFQWEKGRKPIEIKTPGRHILSVTEEGESVVFYDPYFFEEDEAYELMDCLLNTTNWQTKNVTIRGIKYPQPRLVAWYGPFPYSYSGTTLEPAKMPDYIFDIKKKVEQYLRKNGINVVLNSVLLNLYRNNKDSVSWHSDDELSMGVSPTIASVSLGETRKFEMRRKLKHFEDESSYTEGDEYFVHLSNGSLLIMDGSMQKDWQHRVPKEYRDRHGRINLTFRTVYKVESLLPFPNTQVKKPVGRATKKSCRRKIVYDEKTLDCDMNSECSGIVNRTQDLSSLKTDDETIRSEEERGIEPSFHKTSLKANDKIKEKVRGVIETHSYNKIPLKTEDILNESNEEQDSQLLYNKKSNPLNNLNDDKKNVQNDMQNKNIDYDSSHSSNNDMNVGANLGKNESFCTKDSQSVSTNSLTNMKEDACKIKSEPAFITDNEMTFNDEEFIPVNTFTVSSEKKTFGSFSLENLLNYNVDVMNCELFLDYAVALKNRILESIHEFKFPEKSELEVLCKLTDGTQTEDNQKFITTRMCFIVDKTLKLQRDSSSILKSVKVSRQPYHRNRNPYSQRLNQVYSRGSHSK